MVASDLARARSRFDAWRARRQVGSRIPQSLWRLAVQLASRHGVSRTAGALGVDYYGLKKRTEESAPVTPASGPAFLELPAATMIGKQCVLELNSNAGATIRVQLSGYDASEIATLTRTLWNAE